jgi:hypothetical protein
LMAQKIAVMRAGTFRADGMRISDTATHGSHLSKTPIAAVTCSSGSS